MTQCYPPGPEGRGWRGLRRGPYRHWSTAAAREIPVKNRPWLTLSQGMDPVPTSPISAIRSSRRARLLRDLRFPLLFCGVVALLLGLGGHYLEAQQRGLARLDLLDATLIGERLADTNLASPIAIGNVRTRLAEALDALGTQHQMTEFTPEASLHARSDGEHLVELHRVVVEGRQLLAAVDGADLGAQAVSFAGGVRSVAMATRAEVAANLARASRCGVALAVLLAGAAVPWLGRHLANAGRVQSPVFDAKALRVERAASQLASAEADARHILQVAMDTLDAAVVVFDADNRFVFCNNTYQALANIPAALLRPGTPAEDIYRYLLTRFSENLGGRSLDEMVATQVRELREDRAPSEFVIGNRWYLRTNKVLPDGTVIGLRPEITAVKRAQAALQERTELLEVALVASNDGLWDWNIESNDTFFSPRWKALLGYADEEFGNDLSMWQASLHPDERDHVARAVEAHLDGKAPFDLEYRMQHRNGEWRWFHVRGSAVLDAGGRPRRMVGCTTDIHERKAQALEIERTRALLSDAIETIEPGIVRFDRDDRIVFCNQRFRDTHGYALATAAPGRTERSLLEDFHVRHRANLSPEARVAHIEAHVGRMRSFTGVVERRVRERWYQVNYTPTSDGGLVVLSTDVTAFKNVELRLTSAMQRAEAASVAKSQFLANMSHELRTPLNGVIGMLQMLEIPDIGSPYNDYVNVALRAGRSLLDLINDVLDFSRIQSDGLVLEDIPFELKELVADALAPIASEATRKGLRVDHLIDAALPLALQGDSLRLRQVLVNLLGNALKFTRKGTLSLRATRLPPGALVRFEVEDTGVGIPAEQLTRVFERFTQADTSTTRRYGGAGLGLAISQQLVQAMGSELKIDSHVDVGTRLWFDLPLRPSVLVHSEVATAPAATGGFRGRVLVVDDVETNRLVAQAMLKSFGVQSHAVGGAKAAFRCLDEQAYDLVLLDCQMPHINGYEATRMMLERHGDACPPIVAMTAHVAPRDREIAAEVGMRDYLTKPISKDQLREVLQRWLTPAIAAVVTPRVQGRPGDAEVLSPAKLEELRETFDTDGLKGLFTTFEHSMEALIARLEAGIETSRVEELQQVCHAIKGICGNVGAMRLSLLAKRLEEAATAANLEELGLAPRLLREGLVEVAEQLSGRHLAAA